MPETVRVKQPLPGVAVVLTVHRNLDVSHVHKQSQSDIGACSGHAFAVLCWETTRLVSLPEQRALTQLKYWHQHVDKPLIAASAIVLSWSYLTAWHLVIKLVEYAACEQKMRSASDFAAVQLVRSCLFLIDLDSSVNCTRT